MPISNRHYNKKGAEKSAPFLLNIPKLPSKQKTKDKQHLTVACFLYIPLSNLMNN